MTLHSYKPIRKSTIYAITAAICTARECHNNCCLNKICFVQMHFYVVLKDKTKAITKLLVRKCILEARKSMLISKFLKIWLFCRKLFWCDRLKLLHFWNQHKSLRLKKVCKATFKICKATFGTRNFVNLCYRTSCNSSSIQKLYATY